MRFAPGSIFNPRCNSHQDSLLVKGTFRTGFLFLSFVGRVTAYIKRMPYRAVGFLHTKKVMGTVYGFANEVKAISGMILV